MTAPSHDAPLTSKQQAFVDEYLIDINSTQAALRAGYSPKCAGVIGYENLQKPQIQAALAQALEARRKRTHVDQDWIITKLVSNVEKSMQEVPVLDKKGEETGEYTYQGNVANKALELLGKNLGMFIDKHELSGPNGGPVAVTLSDIAKQVADDGIES